MTYTGYVALIEAHPTCGICNGSLKDNGWGGTTAVMTVNSAEALVLPGVETHFGQQYAPLPVCARCLHPESYPDHMACSPAEVS